MAAIDLLPALIVLFFGFIGPPNERYKSSHYQNKKKF